MGVPISDTNELTVDQANLNKFNITKAVKLPLGEERNDWIANNLFDFYKQIAMLYRTIVDVCTTQTCPKMIAGERFEYLWSIDGKEPKNISATNYIQHTLDWVEEQLDDEELFPTSSDKDFPSTFLETCEAISRRLLRIFAHICIHHLNDARQLKEEAHMNTSLKHFIHFVQEYNLIIDSELDPLRDYLHNLA